ncbi:unnamed protein product [Caenorhabditis bovis]|uniref:Uncharacterized protein n=1 Tax=Caenorhabditis bovis TaxID=2654633 RepID=A0A8S1F4X3_9PELO|nr:unnamed protein product [Caenorhabditis bovis]
MKLTITAFLIFAMLAAFAAARPEYKDIDYKLFDDDPGVVIDRIYGNEPKPEKHQHHHHHHHKKTNRLERLKRFLKL